MPLTKPTVEVGLLARVAGNEPIEIGTFEVTGPAGPADTDHQLADALRAAADEIDAMGSPETWDAFRSSPEDEEA